MGNLTEENHWTHLSGTVKLFIFLKSDNHPQQSKQIKPLFPANLQILKTRYKYLIIDAGLHKERNFRMAIDTLTGRSVVVKTWIKFKFK